MPDAVRQRDQTNGELADKQIRHYDDAIRDLAAQGKDTAVAYTMRDKWLEYRLTHQRDGTLDHATLLSKRGPIGA